MKKVYLLYQGDTWLSTSTLRLLSVCTSKPKAIQLAAKDAKDGGEALTNYDYETLESYNQTYSRVCNYIVCEVIVDIL